MSKEKSSQGVSAAAVGTVGLSGNTGAPFVFGKATTTIADLGVRAPGTFASDALELVGFSDAGSASAAVPAPSAHVLTLEDAMRAHGNGAQTVFSSGDVAPDAAAFLASHMMSVAVPATLPESEVSVLPASAAAAAPADSGVATLTGEALPEGE